MNHFNFEFKVEMQNLCEVKAYLGEEVRVGRARQMTWIAGRTWVGLIGGGA